MLATTVRLAVGGLQPLTTIDFPGRLAAVVFTQGCAWRCGYCHNTGLLEAGVPTRFAWDDVMDFLERRQGLLDGVVFSGGEPTLHAGLPDAVAAVRELGFEAGLHTAGVYPERLAVLLPALDWVGFDVKAPWDAYDAVTGVPGSAARARAALGHLLRSGVEHEVRTTWHAGLFDGTGLVRLADELAGLGVRRWVVQRARRAGRPLETLPLDLTEALRERLPGFVLR